MMRVTNTCKKFRGEVGKNFHILGNFSSGVKFFLVYAEKSAPLVVCFVDNVEKLSTENVDNYISQRYINVEKWITIYRSDILMYHLLRQYIATIYHSDTSYIAAIYDVDNVEKLSTAIVDNYISP
jgi:hypothetical protein